ncbi:hypothetical protein ACOSP6_04070 [Tenacibaculum sp. MEBiC06402]|uniref:hypothetical protein n=1 Tax=unclassified Tenacibaculum TaxID=2635139 RepID=UPI003B997402
MRDTWTLEELKAYVLIYAMNADKKETPEEIEVIKRYINPKTFVKMHNEFSIDKHHQGIQKISDAIQNLNLTKDEIQNLFYDMEEVFNADKDFSIVERNIAIGLKRILDF